MRKITYLQVATACAVLLLTACVRIPAEAIQVNTILHANIADAQVKHKALVAAFFTARKDAMDTWFIQEYEPAYMKNFKVAWDKARPTDPFDIAKPADRSEYQQNIIARYQQLEAQIDATEADFDKKIDQAYASMLQQNDAIGKLLQSAKALTDAQKNAWNSSIGKLIPELSTADIDQRFKDIRQNMTSTLGAK